MFLILADMPVINFSFKDLQHLVGRHLDYDTVIERIPMMGADIHSASKDSDEMAFEFFPDRPDLYSVEGIARALKAFLGISPGLRRYEVGTSDVILKVDPSVDSVRPFVWSGLITGVEMNDYLIRSVMDLQEKLHLTVGRNRKKVAIGIHDFDKVSQPFLYSTADPDEFRFLPLQGDREMTMREILQHHDKGKAYAFVLEGKARFPIILDRYGEVLSFPPIINGSKTAVTDETRNVLVDCTGTDLNALKASVNILVTSFAERGAKIKSVEIQKGEERLRAPDLNPLKMNVNFDDMMKLTGINESPEEACEQLRLMGYDASAKGAVLDVSVPAYRYDILHPADITEDLAKGYGYEKFGARMPESSTLGVPIAEMEFGNVIRSVLIGLGYIEVSTLTLTGRGDQYSRMKRAEPEDVVEVLNPRTEERVILRQALLPEIMAILRKNKHRDLPQRIFEVGDVVTTEGNKARIAGTSIHSKASFTEMKSTVEAVMRALGLKLKISQKEDPSFIRGRCASILVEGEAVGEFGEIDPEVITSFELGYPVSAFEITLSPLMSGTSASWAK